MSDKETPAMSEEDAAYLKLRLETMDEQERASMEEFLKAKPGLTAEKYMEEAIAHGF
jgi:hypothetical protein